MFISDFIRDEHPESFPEKGVSALAPSLLLLFLACALITRRENETAKSSVHNLSFVRWLQKFQQNIPGCMYVPVRHQFTGGINKYLSAAQLVVNEPTRATLLARECLGVCVHLAVAIERSRLKKPLPELAEAQSIHTTLGIPVQLVVLGNGMCIKLGPNDVAVIFHQVVARLVVQAPFDMLALESSSIVLVTCSS